MLLAQRKAKREFSRFRKKKGSFQKEVNNLEGQQAVNFTKPVEKDQILVQVPTALLVGMRPILCEKHAELKLPVEERLYKVRIILQGNFVRNTTGAKVIERVEHDQRHRAVRHLPCPVRRLAVQTSRRTVVSPRLPHRLP